MNKKALTLDEFLAKVKSLRERAGVDLSTSEDLSIAVMNLVSLEEHFFFTGVKTKQDKYFDTSNEIRAVRKELLAKLIPNHEGETWCISKHLLAATMRIIEVGTKLQSDGKKDEASAMFKNAYKVYAIFWALKLQLIDGRNIKKAAGSSASLATGSSQLEDLVSKLADCCDE